VATETDAMHAQIVQLGIDFAGVPGPKKVADVVQKRIEKFRTFVPLLHAVCNAGLRERHWLAVRIEIPFIFRFLPRLLVKLTERHQDAQLGSCYDFC